MASLLCISLKVFFSVDSVTNTRKLFVHILDFLKLNIWECNC